MINMSISVNNISKSYKGLKALEDISFDVKNSEIFGLIGPDGAGKSTLFRILTTLLLPDKGQANVASYDLIKDYKKIRKDVGYMPGKFSLYQDLSIEENLSFFATIFETSVAENYELIKDIYQQIEPFKKRKAGALSGGMKQKLALSCALIHKPKVLFLDEPTTGVDPVSRKEFWDMLKSLQRKGITILVSTPYMDEASLCDRIGLIHQGRLLSIDRPGSIEAAFKRTIYSVQADNTYALLLHLKENEHTHSVFPFGESVHYMDKRNEIDKDELFTYLKKRGLQNISIEQVDADIEDVFMEYVRK